MKTLQELQMLFKGIYVAVSVNLFKSRVTRHPIDLTGIRKEPIAGENFKRQERKKL